MEAQESSAAALLGVAGVLHGRSQRRSSRYRVHERTQSGPGASSAYCSRAPGSEGRERGSQKYCCGASETTARRRSLPARVRRASWTILNGDGMVGEQGEWRMSRCAQSGALSISARQSVIAPRLVKHSHGHPLTTSNRTTKPQVSQTSWRRYVVVYSQSHS